MVRGLHKALHTTRCQVLTERAIDVRHDPFAIRLGGEDDGVHLLRHRTPAVLNDMEWAWWGWKGAGGAESSM